MMESVDLSQYAPELALGVVVKALDRWGTCTVQVKENDEVHSWLIEGVEGVFTKINGKVVSEKEFWDSVLSKRVQLMEIRR